MQIDLSTQVLRTSIVAASHRTTNQIAHRQARDDTTLPAHEGIRIGKTSAEGEV